MRLTDLVTVIRAINPSRFTATAAMIISTIYGYYPSLRGVYGGDGNDTISVKGSQNTVSGDDGDDEIRVYPGNEWGYFYYANGEYFVYVKDSLDNNSISGGNGNDWVSVVGNSDIVQGDEGNDTINADGKHITIYGGNGNDYVIFEHFFDDGVVYADDGDDTIVTHRSSFFSSYYRSCKNNTLYGGDGNDCIYIWKYNNGKNLIYGGNGNDTISVINSATISGGAGDDVIDLGVYHRPPAIIDKQNFRGNSLIQYAAGDGNDTVYNFSEKDTLQIVDGVISNIYTNAFDVIVEVG